MTASSAHVRQYRKLERIRARRRFIKRLSLKGLDRAQAIALAAMFVLSVTALVALGYGLILGLLQLSVVLYNLH